MGNSLVLFDVSMEISRRQFHSGKIGYTQKVASPWATAICPRVKWLVKPQLMFAYFHVRSLTKNNLNADNNNNNYNNTLFVLINVNIDTMNRRYQRLSLSRVSPFKSKQFKSTQLNSTQIKSNQIKSNVSF